MIYLDYQATTPLAPAALDAMVPYMEGIFGNPHSSHRPGREARAAVELARERLAAAFGPGGSILFTGGATEAINLALKGAWARRPAGRDRIVTIATEHAAVLDSVNWLATQGADVCILPVGADGIVDLAAAADAITDRTAIVAAMLVNNEIGVVQPVAALSALARGAGALMLSDAVQGFGRVAFDPADVDLVALSSHKIHGPKGIGALWVRDGVALEPQMHGGGQEMGVRSGTLATALCVGFGVAAKIMREHQDADLSHVRHLWTHARHLLGDSWTLNGSDSARYFGNLNVRLPGLDAGRLISETRRIAISAGSACASGSGRPSHVLTAIGLTPAEARSSLRIGFGRYTTADEIEEAMHLIREAANRQGIDQA